MFKLLLNNKLLNKQNYFKNIVKNNAIRNNTTIVTNKPKDTNNNDLLKVYLSIYVSTTVFFEIVFGDPKPIYINFTKKTIIFKTITFDPIYRIFYAPFYVPFYGVYTIISKICNVKIEDVKIEDVQNETDK